MERTVCSKEACFGIYVLVKHELNISGIVMHLLPYC